jgi:hypothetical protein
MWKNAIVATVTMLFSIVLFLFGGLDFLAPYKTVLLHQYGPVIGMYAAMLAVNLYAAFFLLTRKLFLKDTGTKLVHLEKQLRDGSFPRELGEQLSRGN